VGFVVETDRPLARSLARAGLAMASTARDSLLRLEADPGAGVHDARRDIRSARAVLRLVRGLIGEEAYRAQQDMLRRAGRALSPHRDRHVLADALLALEPDAPDELRDALERSGEPAGSSEEPLRMAAASALLELERFEAAQGGWPRSGADDGAIAAGLARTLRRVRKAQRRAGERATVEALHEVRKRCKDARDQARVLMPLSPKRLGRLESACDDVADLLGEARDQWLLAEALEGVGKAIAPDAPGLAERARARHDKLAARALAKAEARLGKLKPRATARKVVGRVSRR
jgi:CHAD domain-containing protein